ncbi:MAG: hypothetical protein OEX81_01315 [Candidatus Pacebacteria bacterium]|nr:hypothetical protein [Candidatus Paceibacterota bacterium]
MSETETTQTTSPQSQKKSGGIITKVLILLLLVGLTGSLAWGYQSNKKYEEAKEQINLLSSIEGQQEVAKQEIRATVKKIGKLMTLPQGEEPVMATVINAKSLATQQDFYKDATDGDKVIVYQKANKAILYNPTKNIVVNVDAFLINEAATPSGSIDETSEVTPNETPLEGETMEKEEIDPSKDPIQE